VLAALLREIVTSLLKGEVGLDIVAGISMSAALAFGETLAAAVVGLMYAGGQLLENFAANRAQSHMRALLARVPKTALRYDDGHLSEVEIDAVRIGDRLLIRQGDIVPVDGEVKSGKALLDMAALTGESVPVRRIETEEVASGAYVATGDHLRMLAVLVSATPCPLILAVPVAIISGMGKAARRGVLMKGGPVLETMARASGLVIDKTGTLTHGRAELSDIVLHGQAKADDVLRLAASLEQASAHVIAASVVQAARDRGLLLTFPTDVRETAGEGLSGHVDGHKVFVGGHDFVRHALKHKTMVKPDLPPGTVLVAVAIAGRLAAHLILADAVRAETPAALERLRRAGISRIVLASGDSQAIVDRVGEGLGIDDLRGGLTPPEKVAIVLGERKNGVVMMAGDGVNDAPALAAADVGISMGVTGSAAASESADAVLLVDDLTRLAEAVETAKRARGIALQSVYAGLGMSFAAMVAAALGYLPVVQGALLQEVIDVAVILNALRALR